MAYGTSSHIEYPAFDVEPPMKVEAYISEFVGTYFLVLTIGFNVLQNTALAPISIGAILMAMIFATGKVSGGHFNPAVTLGVYWRGGKISGNDALSYVGSQLVGALAAGCTYLSILGATFSLGPGAGYGLAAVAIVEVLFTAALVFVVLSVATTAQDDGNWYFGLAIGFTVMAAAFAIGPISGCSLNPAVTFGVLISNFINTGHLKVSILLMYTLAPFFGSVLAVCLFQIIREQEYQVAKGATMPEPRSFRYSQPLSPSQPFAMSRDMSPMGSSGLSPPTSSGRFAFPQV